MWYVIEHFENLNEVLSTISSLLDKKGIFAFATPSNSGVSGKYNTESFYKQSPSDHFSIWNPKIAKKILKKLIDLVENKNAVILDFFAGSGTTFEAVCQLNHEDSGDRRCILIQKDEKTSKTTNFDTISKLSFARCQKVQEIYNEPIDFFEQC